ncbi:MAG TPA: HAMP domain-containing sensor histidine kinase [Solirubrobacteraceae bacterium]|nr:HAMP domain-containing sensor histidine kinase [Solirubrobacteraceae bacterium]
MVIASSLITFVAVYRGTGSQLHKQIDGQITGDADELSHALAASRPRSMGELRAAAASYIDGQPFSASSTLLFVTIPGGGTVTNRPELFSTQLPDGGDSPAHQREEARLAAQLVASRSGYSTLKVADIGNLRLLRRPLHLRIGGVPTTSSIGVGTPLAPVSRAQDGVSRAFVLAGALALIGALLAALLIGTRISDPLRRIASVAARVDAGDLEPRIEDTGQGAAEVRVLADSFNRMLDRLAVAFDGQRAFVADASHELRTPLTVIKGQLEVLAAQERPAPDEVRRVEQLVGAEVARIARLVDDLLLLARSEQTAFLRLEEIQLEPFVAELWDGVETVEPDRRFELGPVPDGTLRADPDRLAQALRNLVRNAIEHTDEGDGRVLLHVERAGPASVRFVVQDDGPGIPAGQREAVFERFYRTDPARGRASGGAGLGLAIVKAIAEAHGGRVRAIDSAAGGARIELELPGFTPGAGGGLPAASTGSVVAAG